MTTEVLFRPFTVGGLTLPNRIVMAPMTRAMAAEGVPGAAQADYYRKRAGVGLILTEGTVIDRPGLCFPNRLRVGVALSRDILVPRLP
ncbi:hypothetical protein [Paracoccus aminovorans]|uniref:oxidoreductase n=1 Tax=Paracoccus aminovorans TaxID=34004 RepID=UPI0007831FE2|nr:hypothetical protein [Paracoccus aminovorans]